MLKICTDFRRAETGMWLYHRYHPHDDLSPSQIFNVVFYDEESKIGVKSIVLRILSGMCGEKGYYDVLFTVDGRQQEGGFLMEAHSIYPVTDKYKAIHEFESGIVLLR